MQTRDSRMLSRDNMNGQMAPVQNDDRDPPLSFAFNLLELDNRHIDHRDRRTFTAILRHGGEQPVSPNNDSMPELITNLVDEESDAFDEST
jgi:hypothetical protein